MRELARNLPPNSPYQIDLVVFKKVLSQRRNDGNKIYSLHEPDVQCISKGKEHKKYEFGNKVSIVHTQSTGVIVGAKSFRNEYDGHTLGPALEQVEKMTGKAPQSATDDRGYRGQTSIGGTRIQIPKPFDDKKQSRYRQQKLRGSFRGRAAIEPVIGHLKADNRLSRNFLQGNIRGRYQCDAERSGIQLQKDDEYLETDIFCSFRFDHFEHPKADSFRSNRFANAENEFLRVD